MQPGNKVRAELFLADAAQVSDGKLNVLGGGWSTTQVVATPLPIAIAGMIHIPWDDTNVRHTLTISLQTANGDPVLVPTPQGMQAYRIDGAFEAGRPPGIPRGTEFISPFALMMMRPPLQPGRYEFRVDVSGTATHVVFDVVAPGQ